MAGIHHTLDTLPSEVLLLILSQLSNHDLALIAQVSHRLRDLAYADCLWPSRDALVTNGIDDEFVDLCRPRLSSSRDRLRVSHNWKRGVYDERRLLTQKQHYMPRLVLQTSTLWISWGSRIWAHSRLYSGLIKRRATRVLKAHTEDVSRFVVKSGLVVSGGRDQTLVVWRADNGDFVLAKRFCHRSEIAAVDVVLVQQAEDRQFERENKDNNNNEFSPTNVLFVTGSRDESVKVWRPTVEQSLVQVGHLVISDRIWAIECNPESFKLAVGTAGLSGSPPIHIVDLNQCTTNLSMRNALDTSGLRRGAGTLEVGWFDAHTLLSTSYDSCVRLWDMRCGSCVRRWEDPFNDAIYCMATDNVFTLITGTARHGMVRLWDMRSGVPVRKFYSKHVHSRSSPVYSVAFDHTNLYIAQDQCLSRLSFAV